MKTTLYFIRHGESESNRITQFAGSLDMPLTQRGREQAEKTAEFLRDVPFVAVYSSDLSRAYDTGLATARLHNIPIYGDTRLREIFAGEWEGKTYTRLEQEYPDSYGVWRTQIGLTVCPGGESVAQLLLRVNACVEDILLKHPGKTVCIATHATPIRVMECIWTDTPLEQMHTVPWVSNASVTVVEYENGQAYVQHRDLHHHLGDLHTVLAKNV